jgi:hypothetical protein
MEQSSAVAEALNPFMDPAQRSMAELISVIRTAEELAEIRRRNLISSIRRFCAARGSEATEVPANHWYFRDRLKRFHPLAAGIKKVAWQGQQGQAACPACEGVGRS